MFKNQSYKQKLSFTKNDDEEHVVNVNITLSTNHELEKNILEDMEAIVSSMFLLNYTETEELVKEQKAQTMELLRQKKDAKERDRREKEVIKYNEKLDRENEKRMKEYDNVKKPDRKWNDKKFHN
jgi:hypothetical protein